MFCYLGPGGGRAACHLLSLANQPTKLIWISTELQLFIGYNICELKDQYRNVVALEIAIPGLKSNSL